MQDNHSTDDMKLTEHFKLSEFTKTSHVELAARQHSEALQYLPELSDLCRRILEPARTTLGVPLIITSGFRCYALNEKINGAQNSQHRFGEAADFVPKGMSVSEAFDILKDSDIPFGQLILEQKGSSEWIHISLGYPYRPTEKSGQALKIIGNTTILIKQNEVKNAY